jgi:hypothetical protein
MSSDQNNARRALDRARSKPVAKMPMRPPMHDLTGPYNMDINRTVPPTNRMDPREEARQRAMLENRRRLLEQAPPNRIIENIPRQMASPNLSPAGKVPNKEGFPCVDPNVHAQLRERIITDGGGSAGGDYYHNWFDSDEENLRNASILGGDSYGFQFGIKVPPVPVTIGGRQGIQDIYIYFDSQYKDGSSSPSNGLYVFSVPELNNATQPIERIIEMEIESFYIPDILTPATFPAYFFYKRVNVEIQEINTQAIYAPEKQRFHWEFDVQPAGISNLLVPLRESKLIFGIPIRELSQATFHFTAPQKDITFDEDTYIASNAVIGTNPGVINLGAVHNLGGPNFIANPNNTILATPGAAGVLGVNKYSWVVTYLVGANETSANIPGTQYAAGTFAGLQANLSNIPIGPAGVTGRRIYRTPTYTSANPPGYFLVTTIADNVTTVFIDNVADGALGAALPLVNNTGLTTQVSVFITGFNSDTPTDAIVNRIDGHLASVSGDTTITLNNTPGADFDLGGTFPVVPVQPFKVVIGYRRIAFSVRFRSLFSRETNTIMPV